MQRAPEFTSVPREWNSLCTTDSRSDTVPRRPEPLQGDFLSPDSESAHERLEQAARCEFLMLVDTPTSPDLVVEMERKALGNIKPDLRVEEQVDLAKGKGKEIICVAQLEGSLPAPACDLSFDQSRAGGPPLEFLRALAHAGSAIANFSKERVFGRRVDESTAGLLLTKQTWPKIWRLALFAEAISDKLSQARCGPTLLPFFGEEEDAVLRELAEANHIQVRPPATPAVEEFVSEPV